MSARGRWGVLLMVLAGGLLAALTFAGRLHAVHAVTVRALPPRARTIPTGVPSGYRASAPRASRLAPRMIANLFPVQTWVVAPPPPPPRVVPPPPPPEAPALPFVYLGAWRAAGHTTYYLLEGQRLIEARAGEVLDGVWRLTPGTGQQLDFHYRPLHQVRPLQMGGFLATDPPARRAPHP